MTKEALAHRLPASPHHLLNPKWPMGLEIYQTLGYWIPQTTFAKFLWEPEESKMAARGLKMANGVYPQIFGCSFQLLHFWSKESFY